MSLNGTEPQLIGSFLEALSSGALEVLDLTAPLSSGTPSLKLPDPFVNLIDFRLEEVAAFNEPGPFWRHNNIHTGEHIGTHLDAPAHWISGRDGDDVSQVPPRRLIGPAVVLDFSGQAALDPDFTVEVADIQAWEAEHGPLPDGAWLLLRTGWDKFADDEAAFLNIDDTGSHTPGISAECARWLGEERPITGLGVETVGIDAGNAGTFDPPFPAHYYLMGNNKYGLTLLQNLAQLPPTGAMLIVAPLPIVGGTGSPARVYALVERRPEPTEALAETLGAEPTL
ncbi:Kynurenine formamidase [Arthrobacter saudimassiliensis]|uniref:Kynurenine formamidase n=1 Tax=Arthrobacter saudimassiliensis TaxID=1461584 RepID=A0A078MWD5_9MICC|nr:Kynurenine formamidase [Arthrobacter saudimassiliensis]